MRIHTSLFSTLAVLAACALAFAGDLEDAQKLKASGRYEEALPLFEKAAAADPSSAEAAQGLVEVLAGLGQWSKAARVAADALKKHPEHVGLLLARSRAHLLMADDAADRARDAGVIQGHAADADQYAARVLAIDPKNSEARVLKVRVLQHQGGLEEAVVLLQEIVKDDPRCFDAQYQLGLHWFREGRRENANKQFWASADACFSAAFEIDATSFDAAANAAHAKAWQQLEPKVVADAYQAAAGLRPADAQILGSVYAWSKGEAADCLRRFKELAKAHPDRPEPAIYLAWAHLNAGEATKAKSVGKKAYKTARDSYFVVSNWARLLANDPDNKGVSEATKVFDEAFGLLGGQFVKSDYDYAAFWLGVKRAGLEESQRVALWEMCWKRYPDEPGAPNNAGLWYREARDFKESIKWYLRAVEASPEDPAILNDAGLIYHFHLNANDKAEPLFVRAIAAAIDQGVDDPDGSSLQNIGYRDAVNNLVKLLREEKRWKDLDRIADQYLKSDPRYERFKRMAKDK
jgi:tetratricopeptide (TPR) repeat protein